MSSRTSQQDSIADIHRRQTVVGKIKVAYQRLRTTVAERLLSHPELSCNPCSVEITIDEDTLAVMYAPERTYPCFVILYEEREIDDWITIDEFIDELLKYHDVGKMSILVPQTASGDVTVPDVILSTEDLAWVHI